MRSTIALATAWTLTLVLLPGRAFADVVPGPSCKCSAADSGEFSGGGALVILLALAALLTLRLAARPRAASLPTAEDGPNRG